MALSKEKKGKIINYIYERAFEIEWVLSDNNFYLAKIAGVNPEQVTDVALKCAIKELKKDLINLKL